MSTQRTTATTIAGLAAAITILPATGPVGADERDTPAGDGEPTSWLDTLWEAESPITIDIDPSFTPEREFLAPCGDVEYNLAPASPIELVDMTGDGSADDRLSIRKDGSASETEWFLHLETADGVRSEAWIPSFADHTPAIGDAVQLDEMSHLHPNTAADEVLVRYGFNDSAQFWMLFGVDERGCLSAYSQKYGSGPSLMLRHDDAMRAGWRCDANDVIEWVGATRDSNGSWLYEEKYVRRDGPTSYLMTGSYGLSGVATGDLPHVGDHC